MWIRQNNGWVETVNIRSFMRAYGYEGEDISIEEWYLNLRQTKAKVRFKLRSRIGGSDGETTTEVFKL